jgi:hypothetical protein
MSNPAESEVKVFGRLLGHATKVAALVQSGYILESLSESYLKRDSLPEPFDVADHIGNFKEASLITLAACGLIGIFACLNARLDGSAEQFKKRARLAAVGAFVASSVVQVVGEKYGLNNVIGGHNTSDMIDAAYGIAWSGVTAGTAYKYATAVDADLRVAREERMTEWRDQLKLDRATEIG